MKNKKTNIIQNIISFGFKTSSERKDWRYILRRFCYVIQLHFVKTQVFQLDSVVLAIAK